MMTKFYKKDWKKGMRAYLLLREEFNESHAYISEWTVSSIGKQYVTVISDDRSKKIRFIYDEDLEQIWSKEEPRCEIYPTKAEAEEMIKKRSLEKEIVSLGINCFLYRDMTFLSVEQLSFLKEFLVKNLSEKDKEHFFENLLNAIPCKEKDRFYRKIWAEHVVEDIQGYADTAGIQISEREAKAAAEHYVEGNYDCNLSYWENIHNLLEKQENGDASDEEVHYSPSSTAGDYSPSNPWDAPGMSIKDFI